MDGNAISIHCGENSGMYNTRIADGRRYSKSVSGSGEFSICSA
jgi:hypothetical protein